MTRRVGVAVISTAVAIALGGCGIDKADERARQLDTIGDVQILTTLCTSGDVDRGARACATYERSHRGQVLVAYRIPEGSEAPLTLSDDAGRLHFSRSDSYSAYLEETYPEVGMHWTGYVSQPDAVEAGTQAALTMSPRLTLPDAGKPFAGPYRYQVVGGYREVESAADDGSASVDCVGDDWTSCVSTGTPGADSSQPVRDLAVVGGGEVPVVAPGGKVSVAFELRFAGTKGATFELEASSDLAGAGVSLAEQTLVPGADSSNPTPVGVAVPAGAAEGTYTVKLTATAVGDPDVIIRKPAGRPGSVVAGTERREGTATFRVVAPPREEPQPGSDTVPQPEPQPAPAPAEPGPEPGPPGLPPPVPGQVEPPVVPQPRPVHVRARAQLRLSLSAQPRHAHNGTNGSYVVIARTVSRVPARKVRVCVRLPRMLQFLGTSRRARPRGRTVCFGRIARLRRGRPFTARVRVHVDTDAWKGVARAAASALAANASRVRARSGMRVSG